MIHSSVLSTNLSQDKDIQQLVEQIQQTIQAEPISDLIDDEGHQYIDLVLEGGGVLGIALAGYTYALEHAGIRFLNIAGTSAGAINAAFLACLAKPNEMKSNQLITILDSMPMEKFIDGGSAAQSLVKAVKDNPDSLIDKIPDLVKLVLNKVIQQKKFGINPGDEFEKWLSKTLTIKNSQQLAENLQLEPHFLKIRTTRASYSARPGLLNPQTDLQRLTKIHQDLKLSIVSADVTTQSKIIFPEMEALFHIKQTHRLAKFIRASMAIPLFFEPVILKANPDTKLWKRHVSYTGILPTAQECYLVDGGIMSNFPIDIFHQHHYVPLCPTFGVKLDTDRSKPNETAKITKFLSALFDTARHTSDFNFLHKNYDYQKLITYIDIASHKTNKHIKKGWLWNQKIHSQSVNKFHWLDFNMSTAMKIELFKIGVQAAHQFLVGPEKFNWQDYKQTRQTLIH